MNALIRLGLRFAYVLMRLYWFVFRPNTGGVHVGIWHHAENQEPEILLIRNSYRPGFSLPSGGLKSGESHLDAAIREVREEVAIELQPEQLKFVGWLETRHEYKFDRNQIFEVHLPQRPDVTVDNREVVAFRWCTRHQAETLELGNIAGQYLAMEARASNAGDA